MCSHVLQACVLIWHCLSYFLCIWKVNFQKFLYRKISLYSKKYLEPTWASMKESFCKKELKAKKSFTVFAKRVKIIDFSEICSFLIPTEYKQTHKPFFWQDPLARICRIFISSLYYLYSHNHKKKHFFLVTTFFLYVCLHVKQIFSFNGKEAYGMNHCKIADYFLILTLLLFALIIFKDP